MSPRSTPRVARSAMMPSLHACRRIKQRRHIQSVEDVQEDRGTWDNDFRSTRPYADDFLPSRNIENRNVAVKLANLESWPRAYGRTRPGAPSGSGSRRKRPRRRLPMCQPHDRCASRRDDARPNRFVLQCTRRDGADPPCAPGPFAGIIPAIAMRRAVWKTPWPCARSRSE